MKRLLGRDRRRFAPHQGGEGEVRAGEGALQAARARVEVVVGGADHLVDLREHGGRAFRCRRRRGQEVQLAVALLAR